MTPKPKTTRSKLAQAVTSHKTKASKGLTDEQQAIIAAAQQARKSGTALVIEAGAGTGKTFTLVELARALGGNGQYTAFNTALVGESRAKFGGTRTACNTTHSLAFKAVGKNFSHRLGGSRVRSEQVARMLGLGEFSVPWHTKGEDGKVSKGSKRLAPGWLAAQVLGAIRRFCQSADEEIGLGHFRYADGIDMPSNDGARTYDNNERLREHLLPFAQKAWQDLRDPEGQLPFSHDHYVKIWQLNQPEITADYILLDEAQDTAPVMLDVLRQQQATVILVGDSAQQIYEWRGAVNALAAFPDAPRLMLSQSFRFGPAIAALANAVLEMLQERTPLRMRGLPTIDSKVEPLAEYDAVLCRTNATAVQELLGAIAQEKRPFLVGGGSDVISFVEAARSLQEGGTTSHPDLACFDSWHEVKEYSQQDDGEDLRLMVKLIDGFGATTIIDALKAMPEEAAADLVISTAHKSKGREWPRVRLASDFPPASKCNDADLKLLYVAVTRAKIGLDVTGCPFFTGKDAPEVNYAAIQQQVLEQPQPQPLLPATPSDQPQPGTFTWSKWDGQWCARGPLGHANTTITIERKDGSTSQKPIGEMLRQFDDAAIYRVL